MQGTIEARTRILDAAERLFAERGFDATATSIIAKVAAVPKGLLFYYFPAKMDILASLVGERLGSGAIDSTPLIEPGNPIRSLLNLSEKLVQVEAASDVIRVIVWREQHTHPEVRKHLAAHLRTLHATIERVLAGSLSIPVAAKRLRTAAIAWGAIVTARPLADLSAGSEREASADSRREDLAALAELLCSGLLNAESLPE